jgi:membrane protease YdiL (CAAX protease family)
MNSDHFENETPEVQPPAVEPHLTIVQAAGVAILVIVLQFLIARIFLVIGVPFLSENHWFPLTILQLVSGLIAAQAGAILAGLSIRHLLTHARLQFLLLLPLAVASSGILILASELGNILNAIKPIPSEYIDVINELFSQNFWGVLVAVAVATPIIEELVFRGVILEGLRTKYSTRTAVLVSAALFGLMHGLPWAMINAFLLGVFLGWLMVKTESLQLCIVAHALYNGMDFVISRWIQLPIPGFNNMTSTVEFQPWWFDVLGFVLLLLGIGGLRALYEPPAESKEAEATDLKSQI